MISPSSTGSDVTDAPFHFRHDFGARFVGERVRVHVPFVNAPSKSAAWWRVQLVREPNPEPEEDPWMLLEDGTSSIDTIFSRVLRMHECKLEWKKNPVGISHFAQF